MNSLIQLKGTLNEKKSLTKPGPAAIPNDEKVESKKINRLIDEMQFQYDKWSNDTIINGALISVFYERIVPKSKRIKTILSKKSEPSNDSIVGAKFSPDEKHIITHFVDLETIKINIDKLQKALLVVNNVFNGCITNNELKSIKNYKRQIEKFNLSISNFGDIIADVNSVKKISTIDNSDLIDINSIINFYDFKEDIAILMEKLNIS